MVVVQNYLNDSGWTMRQGLESEHVVALEFVFLLLFGEVFVYRRLLLIFLLQLIQRAADLHGGLLVGRNF